MPAVPCPVSTVNPHLTPLPYAHSHPDRACCAIRFGTEHEKLGYYVSSLKRLEYSAIRQLLEGLVSRYLWAPIMEGTYIIGAEKDGQSVTIEPGGQFELSGAPLASLHDTDAETHSHLDQVRRNPHPSLCVQSCWQPAGEGSCLCTLCMPGPGPHSSTVPGSRWWSAAEQVQPCAGEEHSQGGRGGLLDAGL